MNILNAQFLILIFFFTFASCKSKTEKTNPTKENITESVYASGVVKSKNQYEVFSGVNGLVTQVLVEEGDLVRAGDPILILTNTTAKLNSENAQIAADYASVSASTDKLIELKNNIDLAQLKMENDATLFERQKNLWAQKVGSLNELEQRELAAKSSRSNYENAKLRYSEFQKQIQFQEKQAQKNAQIAKTIAGDYTIKSETNGKVYRILKEVGEMVNMQTAIALIGNDSAFILELQVDEYDIAKIKTGQKIFLSMDSYKGEVYEAIVVKINPIMNDRSKTFKIEASFVTQPLALFPNLTCEANIVIQEKENVITIPRVYLLEGDSVMINEEKRKVKTGLKDFQKVEILEGLTTEDVLMKSE